MRTLLTLAAASFLVAAPALAQVTDGNANMAPMQDGTTSAGSGDDALPGTKAAGKMDMSNMSTSGSMKSSAGGGNTTLKPTASAPNGGSNSTNGQSESETTPSGGMVPGQTAE